MRSGVVVPVEASLTTRSLSPTTGERVTTHLEGLLGEVIRGVAAEREEEGEVRGEIYVLMTGLVGWRGNICTGRLLFHPLYFWIVKVEFLCPGMTGGSCSRQRWKRNKDKKYFEHPLLPGTPSAAGDNCFLALISCMGDRGFCRSARCVLSFLSTCCQICRLPQVTWSLCP